MVGGVALAGVVLVAGAGGIHIDGLDGSVQTTVTTSRHVGDATWSQDGTTVAFVGARGALFRWRDGVARRVLTPPPRTAFAAPVLTADGSRFAVGRSGDGCVGQRASDAQVVVDGRILPAIPRSLRPNAKQPTFVFPQSWSPDGRLAYVVDKMSAADCRPLETVSRYFLFTIRADGTDRRLLANGVGVGDATWSPDGSRLAYLSGDLTCKIVVDDGTTGRTVASVDVAVRACWPNSDSDEWGPLFAWSPDSRTIFFGAGAAIRAVDVATGAKRTLGRSPATTKECPSAYDCDRTIRAVSPDGSTVLVQDVPDASDDPFHLPRPFYTVATDGSGVARLRYPPRAVGDTVLWRLISP